MRQLQPEGRWGGGPRSLESRLAAREGVDWGLVVTRLPFGAVGCEKVGEGHFDKNLTREKTKC